MATDWTRKYVRRRNGKYRGTEGTLIPQNHPHYRERYFRLDGSVKRGQVASDYLDYLIATETPVRCVHCGSTHASLLATILTGTQEDIRAHGAISFQVDHINGDPTDHRVENLRLLCPNCHAGTPTYMSNKPRVTVCV